MARDFLQIHGPAKVAGAVAVSGAKNSALPLMIATLLSEEPCELINLPALEDITVLTQLLRRLGATVEQNSSVARFHTGAIERREAPYALVKAMRASFWVLGPLLARTGRARVALPGGDAIGTRPVDMHLAGLTQMGADIRMEHGTVVAEAPGGLQAAEIELPFPSVGATHQLLMASARTPGRSVIKGAAREREIVELAEFLSRMGAQVDGAGTSSIEVQGRDTLGGASIEVSGDRIEATTFLLAAAVSAGSIEVSGLSGRSTLGKTVELLEQMGCSVSESEGTISLEAPQVLHSVDFQTAPFPGIATDAQPLLMAALTRAEGVSSVEETIFESRFGHVAEYRRMGAKIDVKGRKATVHGVERLSGAPVDALDIRAAAGLVLMAVAAEGITEIRETHHLDRGYDLLVSKLSSVGVEASRVPLPDEQEVVIGC